MTTQTSSAAPSAASNARRRSRFRPGSAALTMFTWLLALGFFMPVLWMLLTSFKQESEAATSPPTFVFAPNLDQYKAVLDAGAGSYFLNSAIAWPAS